MKIKIHFMLTLRTSRLRCAIAAFALIGATALSLHETCAQQPSSSDQLNQLMIHRQEMSSRAVDETSRRRFEEGKTNSTFPSDISNASKHGVVRALTPEQQKALEHNERGLQLFAKGKLDGAMKEYQAAIGADPNLAAAHNNLGSAYFAAGRFDEAASSFRRACEVDAEYGQAFFNLALVEIKLGHEKEANAMLDAALRAYNSNGEAHFKAGRLKEAEEAFRGMLQIDPEYAPALLRLGLVYNAAGRYEETTRTVRPVAEREPANAAAQQILAEGLYGEQKYEEAATSAERALKLSPNWADACYLAGLARSALGQRDVALAHLARLRQLNSPDLEQKLLDFINKKAPAKL